VGGVGRGIERILIKRKKGRAYAHGENLIPPIIAKILRHKKGALGKFKEKKKARHQATKKKEDWVSSHLNIAARGKEGGGGVVGRILHNISQKKTTEQRRKNGKRFSLFGERKRGGRLHLCLKKRKS